jgi:CMP-N,N'-diacetyllegionaminic acid synthase
MLCIVPARGGSKGIPRKNLQKVGCLTLLEAAIILARRRFSFEDIIVSTDCEEIANHASEIGANVPFLRDPKLATDGATSIDVYWDCLTKLSKVRKLPDIFLVLLPTSPLRRLEQLDDVLKLINDQNRRSEFNGLISVVEQKPIDWNIIPEDYPYIGRAQANRLNSLGARGRQSYVRNYLPNGAFYAFRTRDFLATKSMFFDKTLLYEMDSISSLDIDSPHDLRLANVLIKLYQEHYAHFQQS